LLRIKRVYDQPAAADGERILVDRLWPRGLKRAQARVDTWLKDIAPSDRLRQWFHADRSRWASFRRRYRAELGKHREALTTLAAKAAKGPVTLLYAARDPERNNAVVLKETTMQVGSSVQAERPSAARAPGLTDDDKTEAK
jgi:uncharacterized protein YeaO (DUF488 family)